MRVDEIMTSSPVCCHRETLLQDAARMMAEKDCGAIPVVDGGDHSMRVVGVITDRDIAVRAVAAGWHPSTTSVAEAMSHPVATVLVNASLDECLQQMEQNQIRRMPVVDHSGSLIGIVSQCDVARRLDREIAGLVKKVSQGFDSGH